MSLAVVESPQEAANAVRSLLGLRGACPAFESRFEILRATVWSMAAPSNEVHVHRVLSAALPSWQLLRGRAAASEETLRAELREALSVLQDAGDLLALSGGYWAPATARIVKLPEDESCLLVGGVPSMVLPIEQNEVQYHGPHRHFAKPPSSLATALPVEDLASWARLPDLSLEDWARETIDSHELQTYSPLSSDVFEFYLPGNSRAGAPQFKRWSDNAGSATGTLLSRRKRLFGAREYRLVQVRSGQISAVRELQNIDVRRLMYAFDKAAGNPVRARSRRAGIQREWLFTSELPRAEQRTFATIGRLTIPEERPFERRWIFVRHEEIALQRIRYLGITTE